VFIENLEWINWFQIKISKYKTAILISLFLRNLFRLSLGRWHLVQTLLRRSHWSILYDDPLFRLHALNQYVWLLMRAVDVIIFLLLLLNHNNFLLFLGSLCRSSSDLLLGRWLLRDWLLYNHLMISNSLVVLIRLMRRRSMRRCVNLHIMLLVIDRPLFVVVFDYLLVILGLMGVVWHVLVSS
jgi:hypothetical protein